MKNEKLLSVLAIISFIKMRLHIFSQRARTFYFLASLSTLLLVPPAEVASLLPVNQAAPACTYTIPPEVNVIDGQNNYAQVRPGDVLCLPAGTRGPLRFYNLQGTPERPIIVRNSDGQVRITGTRYVEGIAIISSGNLRITGSGVSTQCGAQYAPSEQECGIELDRTNKGIVVITPSGGISNLEFDHLFIHDTSTQINSRGIVIRPQERQTISGLYAHHNHIMNTSGEGLYIGAEPHGKPLPDLGKMENVEISYNLVEQTGYDGIKVKVAVNNVKVHHNIVRNNGLRAEINHESGIQLSTSVGDIYNNFVVTGIEGIASGRPLDNPGTRYFNNVVVGPRDGGMLIAESNPLIYNNTVVGTGTFAIKATGASVQIFDNIIAGATDSTIQALASNSFNNFIGSIAAAGFVNAAANDYHLRSTSPAINAGRNTGIFPPFDHDDIARPQGVKTDLGAYEFISTGATPTPIPTPTSTPTPTPTSTPTPPNPSEETINLFLPVIRK
jgi:hypothetical protein